MNQVRSQHGLEWLIILIFVGTSLVFGGVFVWALGNIGLAVGVAVSAGLTLVTYFAVRSRLSSS